MNNPQDHPFITTFEDSAARENTRGAVEEAIALSKDPDISWEGGFDESVQREFPGRAAILLPENKSREHRKANRR